MDAAGNQDKNEASKDDATKSSGSETKSSGSEKEQPWVKLRDATEPKEERGEAKPGNLHGIPEGDILLFNGHGGSGRSFAKEHITPYE